MGLSGHLFKNDGNKSFSRRESFHNTEFVEQNFTLRQHNAIQNGMTLEQCNATYGVSGSYLYTHHRNKNLIQGYLWRNPDHSQAIVEFTNGIVTSKEERNLN